MNYPKFAAPTILLIALVILPLTKASIQGFTISTNLNQINQPADYTFTIITETVPPSSASITIKFSSFYVIESKTYTCSSADGLQNTPTCTGDSATNSIAISGGGPYDSTPPYLIVIRSVKNPSSAGSTPNFQITTQKSDGTTISLTKNGPDIQPGAISNVVLTSVSQVAAAFTSLQVSFKTANGIPKNGFVRITFPMFDNVTGIDNPQSMINSSAPLCSNRVGMDSGASCEFINNELRIVNGFATQDTYTADISFTVGSFKNPFSLSPKGPIKIETVFGSRLIDRKSDVYHSITTEASVEGSIISVINNEVNQVGQYFFFFTIPFYLAQGGGADIIFPSTYSISDVPELTVKFNGGDPSTRSVTSNTIQATNVFDENIAADDTNTNYFEISGIQNPPNQEPQTTFQILIRDSAGQPSMLIQSATNWRFVASAGPIEDIALTMGSKEVSIQTSYIFEFRPTNPLPSTGLIEIVFPEEVDVSSAICLKNGNLQNIHAGITCDLDGTHTLQIKDPFPGGYSTPLDLSIEIDLITNPISIKDPEAFIIRTVNSEVDNYIVDQETVELIADLEPGPIPSPQANFVTPSPSVTNTEADYTFELLTKNSIPQNGYLVITFPAQITVQAISTCSLTSGFDGAATCTTFSANNSLIIKGGFPSGPSNSESTALEFEAQNIMNARSTEQSSSFTIQTFIADNYIVDQATSGFTLQLATPAQFSSTAIAMASVINGAQTSYTFTLGLTGGLINSDKIEIYFPTVSSFNTGSLSCTNITTNIATITCAVDVPTRKVTATLTFTSSPHTADLEFTVSGIINPQTTAQTQLTSIIAKPSAATSIIQQKTTGLEFKTTTAAPFTAESLSLLSSDIAVTTEYTFGFTNSLPIPSNAKIVIDFPFDLGSPSIKSSSAALGSPSLSKSPDSRITLSGLSAVVAGLSLQIVFQNIVNPNAVASNQQFTMTTYTLTDDLIETVSTPLLATYVCDDNCVTCQNIATYCTSCASSTPFLLDNECYDSCPPGSNTKGVTCIACEEDSHCNRCVEDLVTCLDCIAPYPLLSLKDNKCYDSCPEETTLNDAGTKCLACSESSNCATCLNTNVAYCTSCVDDAPLLSEVDNKCYSSCPDGTYKDGTKCKACTSSSNCKTCKSSNPSQCTSCPSTFPAYQENDETCQTICQDGSVLLSDSPDNDFDQYCASCTSSSNCKTCDENDLSECKTCPASHPLLSANDLKCYKVDCPEGQTIVGGICVPCNDNCKNCYPGKLNQCSECNEPQVLSTDFKCYDTCPQGTYLDSTNNRCEDCDEACTICTERSDKCYGCIDTKVLYSTTNSCMDECPEGYGPIEGICFSESACVLGCQTCVDKNDCLQCQPGLKIVDQQICVNTCPSGYYEAADGLSCPACSTDGCAVCSADGECSSCNINRLLLNNTCLSACPEYYYTSDGKCLDCVDHCISCSNSETCLACEDGYITDEETQLCKEDVPAIAQILPFVFIILSLGVCSALIFRECKSKEELFFNNALAFVPCLEWLSWALLAFLYVAEELMIPGAVVGVIFMGSVVLNIFFRFRVLRRFKRQDSVYQKWRNENKSRIRFLECLALVFPFRLMRLTFGKLSKKSWCRAEFTKLLDAYRRHNKYAILAVILCNGPLVLCNFIFLSSISQKSQLYLSVIESFIMTLLIVLLTGICYTRYGSPSKEMLRADIEEELRKQREEAKGPVTLKIEEDRNELRRQASWILKNKVDPKKLRQFLLNINNKPNKDDLVTRSMVFKENDFNNMFEVEDPGNGTSAAKKNNISQLSYMQTDENLDASDVNLLAGMGLFNFKKKTGDGTNVSRLKDDSLLDLDTTINNTTFQFFQHKLNRDLDLGKFAKRDPHLDEINPNDQLGLKKILQRVKGGIREKGMNELKAFHLAKKLRRTNSADDYLNTVKRSKAYNDTTHRSVTPDDENQGMDFASITVHNNRWVKPPQFKDKNAAGGGSKTDNDVTNPDNMLNLSGNEEIEFQFVESTQQNDKLVEIGDLDAFSDKGSSNGGMGSKKSLNRTPRNGDQPQLNSVQEEMTESTERGRNFTDRDDLDDLDAMTHQGSIFPDMVNNPRNKNVRFNIPIGPSRKRLMEHLRRNFAHTPTFSGDDDAIARLIKVTMINDSTKRDLKNNQIKIKSQYSFDEVRKQKSNDTFNQTFQSFKTVYADKADQIKKNKFMTKNNFLDTAYSGTPTAFDPSDMNSSNFPRSTKNDNFLTDDTADGKSPAPYFKGSSRNTFSQAADRVIRQYPSNQNIGELNIQGNLGDYTSKTIDHTGGSSQPGSKKVIKKNPLAKIHGNVRSRSIEPVLQRRTLSPRSAKNSQTPMKVREGQYFREDREEGGFSGGNKENFEAPVQIIDEDDL